MAAPPAQKMASVTREGALIALPRDGEASAHLRDLKSGPRYRGALYSLRDGVLNGWAVDLSAPEAPVGVAIEAAGARLVEGATAETRADLAGPLPGNVAGFSLDLGAAPRSALERLEAALAAAPAGALAADLLTLRIGGDGPRIDLGRGGVTVQRALAECRAALVRTAPPSSGPRRDGARFIAGVEGFSGSALVGWAVDLQNPRNALKLALEARGVSLLALETREHRADIGAVLEGNVAGFSVDFAALSAEVVEALAVALAGQDAEALATPPSVALKVEADGSLVDLGAFGVTVGDILRALNLAPALLAAPAVAAPAKPKRKSSGEARALDWMLAWADGETSGARPARRFAEKLSRDIAADAQVSGPIKRHAAEIAGLFDPFFYLDRLETPEEAIANPLLHYVLAGWREGLSPSPLFSPDYYRRLRGPFAGDPLLDFLREGARANVNPHPLFDVAFYRERAMEGEAEANPLQHYLDIGGPARRDPSPLFDTARFLDAYQLGDEVENALEAFLTRPACYDFALAPAFDARLYRYQIEVERKQRLGEPPYVHYLARGFRDETLLPNILFDPAFYRAANKLEFDEPALGHYLREGEAKGYSCHPFFNPECYNNERGGAEGSALVHALAHPGEIKSDPRMEAPIDRRVLAFIDGLVRENGVEAYDAQLYRDANPDLTGFGDRALEAHWRRNGAAQNRLSSRTQTMRLAGIALRDLSLGFVLEDYTSIYKDLAPLKERFVSALFHWARHGRHEKRLIGRWKFRLFDLALHPPTAGAPLHVAGGRERSDVAILIHAFYPDLLPELVAFARNFRECTFDIFINVVDESWTPEVQESLRAICPGAFVMLSNDSGRDIGGLTRLIDHVDLARYDLVAFMHSKKSPHVEAETGIYWRRALLGAIAGSPETAKENVGLFREHADIGMIGCKDWRSHDMGKNVAQYERLLDLIGVRGAHREIDYLSGFMFLVRSEIMARLYQTLKTLDFEYGGDRDLDFHMDGQIAHGVERALPALVRQMGYRIHYR